MEQIIINDGLIEKSEINKIKKKVRVLLLDENNNVLVANYAGIILLPGGSIENGETLDDAIIREIKEETGIVYDIDELNPLCIIKYYQKNYPTRDDEVINRVVTTAYYVGNYKGIDLENTQRTSSEKKGNFNLKLVNFDELLEELNKPSDNPRKDYFNKEMIVLLNMYLDKENKKELVK